LRLAIAVSEQQNVAFLAARDVDVPGLDTAIGTACLVPSAKVSMMKPWAKVRP
jgi:hypothetical protein